MDLTHVAYCGVDCTLCPDYLSGKCPDCRHSQWPEGDPCMPIACCRSRGIDCCGRCDIFPCPDMTAFYAESEGHRAAYGRMAALQRENDAKEDGI